MSLSPLLSDVDSVPVYSESDSPALAVNSSVALAPLPISGSRLPAQNRSGKNNLGTFYGVYLPCMCSIYNVLMYLRFPWFVGCIGLGETLLIWLLSFSLSALTTMSMSAICTNGHVEGGGTYFILSRTLGPALGGSLGLVYWFANTISTNLSILGILSPLMDLYSISITGSSNWDVFILGTLLLFLFTSISFVGAKFFARVSTPLFLLSLIALFIALLGYVTAKPGALNGGFTGFSSSTMAANWGPPETSYIDTSTGSPVTIGFVFAIAYPCFTGILAGANMSGDLKDPANSIPKGTFLALITVLFTYTLLVLFPSASLHRSELQKNFNVTQNLCFFEPVIVYAIALAGIQASLAGLMGSARVLQAIAKDDLIPGLWVFARGSGPANEPRLALLFTSAVVQVTLFITEINVLSPVLTQVFLLAYGSINFAAFLLAISGVANFRPRFKYFHWSLSLIGGLGCLISMLVTDWATAFAALAAFLVVTLIIAVRDTGNIDSGGQLGSALIYHQLRKYLLRLGRSRQRHVKYWRPELQLFCSLRSPASMAIINVGNSLKKGGLYSVHCILTEITMPKSSDEDEKDGSIPPFQRSSSACQDLTSVWREIFLHSKVKAFPSVIFSPRASVLDAVRTLLLSTGIGPMTPNIAMWPFPALPETAARKLIKQKAEDLKMSEQAALQAFHSLWQTGGETQSSGGYGSTAALPDDSLPADPLSIAVPLSSLSSSVPSNGDSETLANCFLDLERFGGSGDSVADPHTNVAHFSSFVRDALAAGKNVIIARSMERLDSLMRHRKAKFLEKLQRSVRKATGKSSEADGQSGETAHSSLFSSVFRWSRPLSSSDSSSGFLTQLLHPTPEPFSHANPFVIEVCLDAAAHLAPQDELTRFSALFALQMAFILSSSKRWRGFAHIRLISFLSSAASEDAEAQLQYMKSLLKECRVFNSSVIVVPLINEKDKPNNEIRNPLLALPWLERCRRLGALLQQHSATEVPFYRTAPNCEGYLESLHSLTKPVVRFLSIPDPLVVEDPMEYASGLAILSPGLPTLYLRSCQQVIATEL